MKEHWDERAKASYLTFPPPGIRPSSFGHDIPGAYTWVSFESPRALQEKGRFVRAKGYGGAMVWTLNEGALPDHSQALLEALASALGR
jgi:chitinase